MARVVEYNTTLGGYEQWLYLKDEMVSYIGASMLMCTTRCVGGNEVLTIIPRNGESEGVLYGYGVSGGA